MACFLWQKVRKFTKHQLVGNLLTLGFNCLSFRGDRQLQSQGRRQWGAPENFELVPENQGVVATYIYIYISTRWVVSNYVHPLNEGHEIQFDYIIFCSDGLIQLPVKRYFV